MFSTDSNTCGLKCNPKKSKRSILEPNYQTPSSYGGWTEYYHDDDDPSEDGSTGDHEHYFYFRKQDWNFRGDNGKNRIVYAKDGQAYRNCSKTAIFVRKRETHV